MYRQKLQQISVHEAMDENRPRRNHFEFVNKVDFLLHKVTLRGSTCSFAVEKPSSTNSKCELAQSQSCTERADVIRPTWWPDHATFINRAAINTDNKGQKHEKTKRGLQKIRICCLPEDAECSACLSSANYPHGLFGVGRSLPWPHYCCLTNWKHTHTSLLVMWLL